MRWFARTLALLTLIAGVAAPASALPVATSRGASLQPGTTDFDWDYAAKRLTIKGTARIKNSTATVTLTPGGTAAVPTLTSTGHVIYVGGFNANASSVGTLKVSTDAIAVSSTVTETDTQAITLDTSKVTAGKVLRLTWVNLVSTTGTPTLTTTYYVGGTSAYATGAVTQASGASFALRTATMTLSFRSVGASGTLGIAVRVDNVGGADGATTWVSRGGGPATETITKSTTTTLIVKQSATWGTSSSSNIFNNYLLYVEELN